MHDGASGLAVCATAREHGVTDAAAWVPLLAKVLLDRDVTLRHVLVPNCAAADAILVSASGTAHEQAAGTPTTSSGAGAGARQAAGTARQLAQGFRQVSTMLDERPYGLLLWRAVGKLSVVGLPAGWLDERGGIRRVSRRTAKLLRR